MENIRLDRFLADAGAGTRSEVRGYIRRGRVLVDGAVQKDPGWKICRGEQTVCLDGKEIRSAAFEYYMLHKQAGCVSAVRDDRYPTVLDGISSPHRDRLFPVGRLDLDTEGLLLITDDGELAHRLLSPRRHVDKTYYAEVSGSVTDDDVRQFAQGMDIGEERRTLPARLEILAADGERSQVQVTIQEGKFHQIKRMFQTVGREVLYLRRIRMGSLRLDETLQKGQYRALTEAEVADLKEEAGYE